MAVFTSKYTGQQVEDALDSVSNLMTASTVCFAQRLLGDHPININAWELTNFTFVSATWGSYTCYVLQEGGVNATKTRAADCMKNLTGLSFVPEYSYEFPYCIYIIAPSDGQAEVYKMQWGTSPSDSGEGLYAFKVGSFAFTAN